MTPAACPLCNGTGINAYCEDSRRVYYQCGACDLVFVPAVYHLDATAEKAEYDLHDNTTDDSGYRRFLRRALDPLTAVLVPGQTGLDFGCGEGKLLSVMAQEKGLVMDNYDLYYCNDLSVFDQHYDFIAMTEVIEHLRKPKAELTRLWRCLKPGGYLCIMTKRVFDQAAFSRWHYKNDQTHIAFFSEATFTWLAAQWNANLTFPDKDVAMLQKPAP